MMTARSWPLTDDGLSTAAAVTGTIPPWTTNNDSNWKALVLGLFVIAGVTGKCDRCESEGSLAGLNN